MRNHGSCFCSEYGILKNMESFDKLQMLFIQGPLNLLDMGFISIHFERKMQISFSLSKKKSSFRMATKRLLRFHSNVGNLWRGAAC